MAAEPTFGVTAAPAPGVTDSPDVPGSSGFRPRIPDPRTVPLDPGFGAREARGRPVPRERLVPRALRDRFAAPPAGWSPEVSTDGRILRLDAPPRPAAVLVPFVLRDDAITVLLTQRTAHLHDHAGQISFPGGRVDPEDRDAVAAALREAHEEIGLDPASVEVIGSLPEYVTATSYRVTPVVALVQPPEVLRLDAFEVAEAFEVPLSFLMDPANHERRRFEFAGHVRHFYAMPYGPGGRHFIWGATAAMLRNLYGFLSAD